MEAKLVAARSPATTYANGRFTWEGLLLKALQWRDQGWPDDKVRLHPSLQLIAQHKHARLASVLSSSSTVTRCMWNRCHM